MQGGFFWREPNLANAQGHLGSRSGSLAAARDCRSATGSGDGPRVATRPAQSAFSALRGSVHGSCGADPGSLHIGGLQSSQVPAVREGDQPVRLASSRAAARLWSQPLSQHRGTRKPRPRAGRGVFSIPKPHLGWKTGPGSLTTVYASPTLASSSSLWKQTLVHHQSSTNAGPTAQHQDKGPSFRGYLYWSHTSNLTWPVQASRQLLHLRGAPRGRVDDANGKSSSFQDLRRYGAADACVVPRRAAVRDRWRTPEVGSEKKMKLERDERSWAGRLLKALSIRQ